MKDLFLKGDSLVDASGNLCVAVRGNSIKLDVEKLVGSQIGINLESRVSDLESDMINAEYDIEELQNEVGNNYSTTEHEVGTWIDGRTIYERTFELESTETLSSGSLGRFVALEDIGLVASDIIDAQFYGTNIITRGTVEMDTEYLWVNAITAISCNVFTLDYLKDE